MKDKLELLPKHEALRLRSELTGQFLDGPAQFNPGALLRFHWIAVPVQERINQDQARRIARQAQKMGINYGLSVTTHPDANVEANRVALTEDGILAFDANCLLRQFLLVAEGERFALLEEGDYYCLIGGPPDFVAAVVGSSIEDALDFFEEYVVSFPQSRQERNWLLTVLERYRGLQSSS